MVAYGFDHNATQLIHSYLTNRGQRVRINSDYSTWSEIITEIPQGSILGPLVFNVYLSDYFLFIEESDVANYADDNSAYQWKMEFNPDPSKQATEVLFSCKKVSPGHPQLTFNGTVIKKVNEQKHLGLILDSSLSFKKHLDDKIKKAKKNIGIIKHLSNFLPLKTLDQMYKALVRPHLDYCDIIYHIPPSINPPPQLPTFNSLMEKLEIVQYQAALAVTGA